MYCHDVIINNIYIVSNRPPGGDFCNDIKYPSGSGIMAKGIGPAGHIYSNPPDSSLARSRVEIDGVERRPDLFLPVNTRVPRFMNDLGTGVA